MAYYIGQVGYSPTDEFTLGQLGDRLYGHPDVGTRFSPQAIVRYLKRYFAMHLEAPVSRAERSGYWRINSTIYAARPPPAALKRGRPRKRLELTDGGIDDQAPMPNQEAES